MMNENEPAAGLLDAAHDVLLVNGWTKRTLRGPNGERCALGAIFHAAAKSNELWLVENLHLTAGNALAAQIGRANYLSVPEWNDAPERTLDEVLDAFRHAAKTLRNQ